jgi:hypothetical protein
MRWLPALALVGCAPESIACPAPAWVVPASGESFARAAADGSIFVADGTTLEHVGAGGDVVRTASIGLEPAWALRTDDAGGVVVKVGTDSEFTTLVRFDASFAMQWKLQDESPELDIAPTGQVAYWNFGGTFYLDATGTQQWKLPSHGALRLSATGELYVFDFGFGVPTHRLHYSTAGVQLDDTVFPAITGGGTPYDWYAIGRDGSLVYIDDPYQSIVTSVDATGAVRWQTTSQHTSLNSPAVAANGDVLAVTDLGTAIVRFDGQTGAVVGQAENCNADGHRNTDRDRPLVAGDAGGYVLLTAAQPGLAAYPGP